MSARARKIDRPVQEHERQLREINELLLVSAVRQHELTEHAERTVEALQHGQEELKSLNELLERRVSERTAALTKSHQQLRALVKRLGQTETHERKRIATELHDNLAQLLAVCKMRVSAIEAAAPANSSIATDALAVKELLGQGIEYARTMMSDLRPDTLNEYDLRAAMQWVARRMEQHGLVVRVQDDSEPKPLNEELLALTFDCVRELLFNVVKHAGISEATVSLRRTDAEVYVTVSDAGSGFDTARLSEPSETVGYGLFSISERLSLLGGRTEVKSVYGGGTAVRLVVPLHGHGPRQTRDAVPGHAHRRGSRRRQRKEPR
jgi:signal transduction histidine kinase